MINPALPEDRRGYAGEATPRHGTRPDGAMNRSKRKALSWIAVWIFFFVPMVYVGIGMAGGLKNVYLPNSLIQAADMLSIFVAVCLFMSPLLIAFIHWKRSRADIES